MSSRYFSGGQSAIFAPIKGNTRKGFVIGWIAIVVVGIAGFGLATVSLSHSSAELKIAQAVVSPLYGPPH